MERQDDAKLVLVIKKMRLIFSVKTWAEIQHCLDVVGIMLRHDVASVIGYQTRTVELPSLLELCPTILRAAMHCVVRDAHRCSAVVVESHVPYSRSGRNALCIVRDVHRYSAAVVTESYVPYSRSDRNALYLVRDAHRYSAVVIEGYAPYSRSGRNALLCSARRAPLQCRRY